MIDRKHVLRGLLPFLPLAIGAALKFTLIDKPGTDVAFYFFESYLRPAWLEFIVTAYITGIAAMLSSSTVDRTDVIVFAVVPALCFVFCLLLSLGTLKLGVESDALQVYVPALIAAATLSAAGGRVGKSS